MAIGGIGGGAVRPGTFGPKQATDAAADRRVREQAAQQAQATAQQTVAAPAAAGDGAIPVEAPPGTDPMLWSVLTAEERRFFTKLQALGPLTYGPRPAGAAPALARGGRIDTTV